MSMSVRTGILTISFGAAGTALLLGACSSGAGDTAASPAEETVTVTAAPTPAASAAPTAMATEPTAMATPSEAMSSAKSSGGGADTLPKAPSGADQLADKQAGGATYARYSVTGMTAQEVGQEYKSQAEQDGFTITSSGGGGGGWGQWGGSEYGLTAEKDNDSFLAVQAGGSKSGPTYFEVCVGPDKSSLEACDEHSQDTSDDSDSGGS
jgi:hypothetical protein